MPLSALRIASRLCAFVFLLAWVAPATTAAQAYNVTSVPNPRADHGGWITDPRQSLSSDARSAIEARFDRLHEATGAEATLVILPSIGDTDPRELATALFERWGVGRKGVDDGVLLVHVLDQRRVEIETGYGLEGVLTDAACARVLREKVLPLLKEGQFDQAHEEFAQWVLDMLEVPPAYDPLPASAEPVDPSPPETAASAAPKAAPTLEERFARIDWALYWQIALWLFVAGVLLGFTRWLHRARKLTRDAPRRAYTFLEGIEGTRWIMAMCVPGWVVAGLGPKLGVPVGPSVATAALIGAAAALVGLVVAARAYEPDISRWRLLGTHLFGVLSLGVVIVYIYARDTDEPGARALFLRVAGAYVAVALATASLWLARAAARHYPRRCRRCRADMQLLSEEDEDTALGTGLSTEEELGSQEHDVWRCAKGHYFYESYPGHTHYSDCPKCRRAASRLTRSVVLREPTRYGWGLADNTYYCAVCKRDRTVREAVASRGSWTGSSTGGSSLGGGSSGGGSFGGGSSGGGGAGGSY